MTKRRWQIAVAASIIVALGALLLASVVTSLNPIVVGAREGSRFQAATAASIVAGLTAGNYASELMTIEPSQAKGRSAESADSPVDIEITAEPLKRSEHPDLVSLGVIIELPLLLVIHAEDSEIRSPRDLVGKQVELGAPGTTIASVAEELLANYGVTEANSTFNRRPDSEAFAAFTSKRADAAFVYFNPELRQIEELALGGTIQILDLPENIALAGAIGSVVPATVPRGAFSIERSRPDRDIPTVAVPVTVVANRAIRDGAAYAIVRVLAEEFSGGSVLAPPGTFPKVAGGLPTQAAALEYLSTGAVPWQYEALPGFIADQWTALLVFGSLLLLVASVYSVFFPEVYGLWTGILRPKLDRKDRAILEAALARGRELTPRQRARLRDLLDRPDAGQ